MAKGNEVTLTEADFKPVAVEAKPGEWTPLPSEITATGPGANEQVTPPKANAPLLGVEVPSDKQRAANIMRYGIPIAASLAIPEGTPLWASLAAGGSMAGLGEITARQIERASTDPELDILMQDLKAGGITAGADVALSALSRVPYVGPATTGALIGGALADEKGAIGGGGLLLALAGLKRGMSTIGRRILIPKELPPDVELAQTILGKMKSEAPEVRKWWQFMKKTNDPFSVSLDQLNQEGRGLVSAFTRWTGSIARGGTGSARMVENDLRNERKVAQVIKDYFETRTNQKTSAEFGAFMKETLGMTNEPGTAFVPVEALRGFLYDRFERELAKHATETVDLTALRQFFKDSSDPRIIGIYAQLKSAKLLPPLEGIETRTVKRTATTTLTKTASKGKTVADITKKNLLKAESLPKRTFTETQAQRDILGERRTETERIYEILSGSQASKEDIDLAWKNIPIIEAEKVPKLIGKARSTTDEMWNNQVMFIKNMAKEPFDKVIAKIPNLSEMQKTADLYFGQKQKALYTATIDALRKAMIEKPSGVAATLDPLLGNAAEKYDQMMQIKKALYFSAATPEVEDVISGVVTKGLGRADMVKLYDDSILKPLKFRFVDAATDDFGRINPKKLLDNINQIQKESPEMLKELWGGEAQVKYIKELALTQQYLHSSNPGKSIFIQLKTAGAVGAVGGATWSYFNGDDPYVSSGIGGIAGITTVLISPIVFSHILANPRLIRGMITGLRESADGRLSTTLAMTLRKASEMKLASKLFRAHPSADTMSFYNFAPVGEAQTQ